MFMTHMFLFIGLINEHITAGARDTTLSYTPIQQAYLLARIHEDSTLTWVILRVVLTLGWGNGSNTYIHRIDTCWIANEHPTVKYKLAPISREQKHQ